MNLHAQTFKFASANSYSLKNDLKIVTCWFHPLLALADFREIAVHTQQHFKETSQKQQKQSSLTVLDKQIDCAFSAKFSNQILHRILQFCVVMLTHAYTLTEVFVLAYAYKCLYLSQFSECIAVVVIFVCSLKQIKAHHWLLACVCVWCVGV